MKNWFYIILAILLAAVAVGFTLLNPGDVPLNFYFVQGEFKIALVILLAVLAGVFLGWLVGVIPSLGKGRQLRKVEKKLKKSEQEVENLRKLPITEES